MRKYMNLIRNNIGNQVMKNKFIYKAKQGNSKYNMLHLRLELQLLQYKLIKLIIMKNIYTGDKI